MIYEIKTYLNRMLVKQAYKYYKWLGYKHIYIVKTDHTPDYLCIEVPCVGGCTRAKRLFGFKFYDERSIFLIEKDNRLYDSNGAEIWINGCSGCQVKNRKRVKPQSKWDLRTRPAIKPFHSRKQAEKYLRKNNLDGKVYFYGGCGCCGCWYEDDDGKVKAVTWKQFWPKDKDKKKYSKQLKEYKTYIKRNKKLLNGNAYLYYGENIKK